MAHPVSYLPTQPGNSHSVSSGEELVSEILDRIISSPSHACLSGKNHTTHTISPPMSTHTFPKPLFPSSTSKKAPHLCEAQCGTGRGGEAEERGLTPLIRGAPIPRPRADLRRQGADSFQTPIPSGPSLQASSASAPPPSRPTLLRPPPKPLQEPQEAGVSVPWCYSCGLRGQGVGVTQ